MQSTSIPTDKLRSKDDLFDNSVMTIGEHLEELRSCLGRALLCWLVGTFVGLIFADRIVLFVQRPLEKAIRDFHSARDVARMGFDVDDPATQPLADFLRTNAVTVEVVYDIPKEYQTLAAAVPTKVDVQRELGPGESFGESVEAIGDAMTDGDEIADSPALGVIDPKDLGTALASLPDVNTFDRKLQLRQNEVGLNSLKLEEPFFIWFKAGLMVGVVLASPGIFYYLWSFVAAGLHAHERRYVYTYLPLSVALFISGVVIAFFLVLRFVIAFFLSFNGRMDVSVEPRLNYYINFVLLLPLGFGAAFQLPLVMFFLQRIGIIETRQYIEGWRNAVIAIFFFSMLLTPADITSMVALAIPMSGLYVLGILMCKYIPRGRGMGSTAYDPA